MSSSSSSAQRARETLGRRLREVRVDAGLSRRELATLMARHPSKTSRIEQGTTLPSADDVRTWCGHCRVGWLAEELVADLPTVDTMWLDWRRME